MVTTRRQSGKLTEVTKHRGEDFMDSDDELDYDDDVSEDSDDEGSDWEEKPSRNLNERAPAKRAKFSNSPSPNTPPRQSKIRRKSVSLLPTMPMDIQFEILRFMSPKDLISLTRASKSLRAMLMTRNAITVWKSARENLGCPACPADFSEPRWAVLIFENHCENCGTKYVLNVDFGIRRRVCVSCRKKNLIVASRFPRVYPNYDDTILTFIPYTNVGGFAEGRQSSSKFYWASDIDDTAKQLADLKEDVRKQLPGAKQKLNEFQIERMELVQSVRENVDKLTAAFRSMVSPREDKRPQRYSAIIARFESLGYLEADIRSGIQSDKECHLNSELTDRIWKRIQPILEPQVLARQAARITAAREVLLKDRKRVVGTVYRSYLGTIVPSQWLRNPTTQELCKFAPFAEVVNSPDEVTVNESSFEEAMSTLPGLISVWSEKRKSALREKIPSQLTSDSRTIDPIDLATTVFECGSTCDVSYSPWGSHYGKPLFAYDGASSHHCKLSPYNRLSEKDLSPVFSNKGSAAATSLVSLAGLSATHATPADMDQCDLRFFCSECTAKKRMSGLFARSVYTWRAGVAHAMKHTHPTDPTWQVLTSDEANIVKLSETLDPVRNESCWTCNHCATYVDNWTRRDVVIEHLLYMHDKVDCTEPQDLFYFPDSRRSTIRIPVLEVTSLPIAEGDKTATPTA
ncbi:hypothetical protein FPV67DRAFT_1495663 [Lyophyllum atratum]|nr:hypothetical protein FPV67DRAFT_1495663 [Lyophyllum atratum]